MSKPFNRPQVCARRALSLLFGLTVVAACGGTRPGAPEAPVPRANEAPIDLITSVPTPTNVTPAAVVATPIVTPPEPLRDLLEPADVRAEFTHLFAAEDGAEMPPLLYQSVLQFVDIYSGRARESFALWLGREGRWGPMIREELRVAGLPEDLIYLSLIESGFSNTAVSRARAAGMWQFMETTARAIGLRVDEWVDERLDPQLSTWAAIRHLRWLHGQTQDWALAAAAYNAGLGRVNRIQKDAGEEDYFRLVAAGRLPHETRNYVPAILAAALIAHNRERFGFGDVQPEPPFQFETMEVAPLTRLSAVAKVTGSSERRLRELNPQLRKGAAPPGARYRLRIPYGSDVARTNQLLANLSERERLLPRDRWTTIRYTVRAGDGWGAIAQRHHTTITELKKQNPRVRMLHPGMKLKVRVLQHADRTESAVVAQAAAPQSSDRSSSGATSQRSNGGSNGATSQSSNRSSSTAPAAASTKSTTSKRTTHTVRSGETMSGIAERYSIPLRDLARWNGMSRPRPVRVGERLRLTPPEPTRHRVTAGETLSGLARRYDVALRDLMKWNGIARPRGLRIGETLIVSARDD